MRFYATPFYHAERIIISKKFLHNCHFAQYQQSHSKSFLAAAKSSHGSVLRDTRLCRDTKIRYAIISIEDKTLALELDIFDVADHYSVPTNIVNCPAYAEEILGGAASPSSEC